MEKLPEGLYPGELPLGGLTLPVCVLDDGTRVFSERGMMGILNIRGRGARSGRRIASILDVPYIRPLISKETWADIGRPIRYRYHGDDSFGYRSTILGAVVKALVQANKSGALRTPVERRYGENAEILRDALVDVAVDSLIDEVTGYQKIRDSAALRTILDKYLGRELAAWAKRFPDEFYQEIFRLKGWEWKGMHINRPSVIGHYTNAIVYNRLAPGLLEELQCLNPANAQGERLARHHQWLSDEVGHPKLRDHLIGVVALMRGAPSWKAFLISLRRAYPKTGDQVELDLC